jgi:hypothetical protein
MAISNDTHAPAKPLMAGCQQEPCSPSSTPETDEAWDAVSRTPDGMYDSRVPISDYAYAMLEHSRKMERERNAALDALDKIESHYVDGDDTYEAWKAMGEIAAAFLAENV